MYKVYLNSALGQCIAMTALMILAVSFGLFDITYAGANGKAHNHVQNLLSTPAPSPIEKEIVYLDTSGKIHVYDTNQRHETTVDWSSPEEGFIDFSTGDFNNDGDMEIVAIKNNQVGESLLVIYDPVVTSTGVTADGLTPNGISWAELYRKNGTDYSLIETGDFDLNTPGDELLIVANSSISMSTVSLLKSNPSMPSGEGWITHTSVSHPRSWESAVVGDINGTGSEEIVLIDSDAISRDQKSMFAVYRTDTDSLFSDTPLWSSTSSSNVWLDAAIGDVIPGGENELVAIRDVTGAGTLRAFIFQYDAANADDPRLSLQEEEGDALEVHPSLDYVFLADISNEGEAVDDQEIFFIYRAGDQSTASAMMVNRGDDSPLNDGTSMDIPLSVPSSAIGGDLDGDGTDELVFACEDGICIHIAPFGVSENLSSTGEHMARLVRMADLDRNGVSHSMMPSPTPTSPLAPTPNPSLHPDGWDLSFGTAGRLSTGCQHQQIIASDDQGNALENFSRVLVQSTGKILVTASCNDRWSITRYLPNGTVDTSFGANGTVQTDFNIFRLQEDDKIIATMGLKVARLTADGDFDATFGNQGIVDAFSSSSSSDQFIDLAVTTDNTITAFGQKGEQRLLARFNATGILDSKFNGTGYRMTALGTMPPGYDRCVYGSYMVDQPDGKVVTAHCAYELNDPFNQSYTLITIIERFGIDGQPDSTFGDGGQVIFRNSEDTYYPIVSGLGIQSNGNIIVAIPDDNSFRIIALRPDGTRDSAFQSPTLHDVLELLTVDQFDRILVRFGIGPHVVQRYLSNGTKDSTFGIDGEREVPAFSTELVGLAPESADGLLLHVLHTTTDIAGPLFSTLVRYKEKSGNSLPTPLPSLTPEATPIETPSLEPPRPLVLIYAVLDNNLGESWNRLLNNIEAGAVDGINVQLLIDGPSDNNDVYVYDIVPDQDPFCPSPINITCDGRYVLGDNFWQFGTEDTAHPASIYQFLVDAHESYPDATQTILSLVGHGSGWSANVLPGQPRVWHDQNDTLGGMLWDDHPQSGEANSNSLSTLALGDALNWASNGSGKKIDLLYLDGCSMGMVEVAYELRSSTDYLLSSPNIDWASFNYNNLLPEVANGLISEDLGKRWLELEAAELRENPGHPFTLSLTDLNAVDTLATSVDTLAGALVSALPTERTAIENSFNNSERFDSNFDGVLNNTDNYIDLADFAAEVAQGLAADNTVRQAAQAVESAANDAVIARDFEGGVPWVYANQTWEWDSFGGLAIYLPLGVDEQRRQLFYNQTNLTWADDTQWDEFLDAYWAGAVQSANVATMPVCRATTDSCEGLANPLPEQDGGTSEVFLPIVNP